VPLYPKPLQQRHPQATVALQQAVKTLQTRTSVIDSGFPVAVLPAVISPSYSGTGNPQVYANGATTLTGPYACLSSYAPKPGDSVLLVPVPALQTYVIAGNTTEAPASTVWQTVTLQSGWSGGTIQYRFLDAAGLNVQITGVLTLPSGTAGYNSVLWGTVAAAYQPAADRNWPAVPLSGTTYSNATYTGAPHCFIVPTLGLYLWGIPAGLNGEQVDVSGIYPL
jgi:hypothetical protein